MPFFSNVAVCQSRAVFRLPVVYEKVPVEGLYSSACGEPGGATARNQHHAVV